ncbi:DUF4245 domain-containing protein [Luteococcus peritonei]|uniref:DUF4245 domain-containing protein n=1 Tax=Luteococcus peritonei TaxID=88874 RepID=A0ABW4RY48_9ACTN
MAKTKKKTALDMLISLAVILVPAALIYGFFSQVPDEPSVAIAPWEPITQAARDEGTMTVLAPTVLPADWKPVRAKFSDDQLELGFQVAGQTYYELKQRPGTSQRVFVDDATRKGVEEGTSTVNGRSWTRYVSEDGRTRCLVNVAEKPKPTTTVACADGSYEQAEAFAGMLR